jgi:ribosome-binding protein aMBF1 (putative translation factor)
LPEADKGCFIVAHDDSGVGAADESSPISAFRNSRGIPDHVALRTSKVAAAQWCACIKWRRSTEKFDQNFWEGAEPCGWRSSQSIGTLYKGIELRRYNVNFYLDTVQMKAIQLRMARAAVGWGVRELAEKAGVTANTVTRIENGADAKQSTMDALQRALEAAGVEFSNGDQPGVRLTKAAAVHASKLAKKTGKKR